MTKPFRLGGVGESRVETPVESLLHELRTGREDNNLRNGATVGGLPSHEAENGPELAVATVMNTLFPDTDFRFDERRVKDSLDELLVTLVALRDQDTHGKGLMSDLATLFDSRLSPGTVYPRLHELEDDGILRGHEMVRTKEYHIADAEASKARVEAAMYQHLALGCFFNAALRSI